jgi:hypothetical protein
LVISLRIYLVKKEIIKIAKMKTKWWFFIIIIFLLVLGSAYLIFKDDVQGTQTQESFQPTSQQLPACPIDDVIAGTCYCGDGVCNSPESSSDCPEDCN